MNESVNKMITRRSVRKFKSDMIPKEVIDEIVTAGTYAASGRNMRHRAEICSRRLLLPLQIRNSEIKFQKSMLKLWENRVTLTRFTTHL